MPLDHVNDFFNEKDFSIHHSFSLSFVYSFVLILNNGSISKLIN